MTTIKRATTKLVSWLADSTFRYDVPARSTFEQGTHLVFTLSDGQFTVNGRAQDSVSLGADAATAFMALSASARDAAIKSRKVTILAGKKGRKVAGPRTHAEVAKSLAAMTTPKTVKPVRAPRATSSAKPAAPVA